MALERIPLFPLEVVLLPGTPLPLHIFEPRYRLMVKHCLEHHSLFGVVLARSESIAEVGCGAEIVEIVKKYDDGRMDILTIGRAPFRVSEVFRDQPYLEGAVEFLEEDTSDGPLATRRNLQELYEKCHKLIYGSESKPTEMTEGYSLTFQIATELPLDLDYKQELLEIRAESARQERLLERLNQWLPKLAHVERVRAKAVGNGHGFQ